MSFVVRELSQSPGVGDLRDETGEPTSERGGEDARVLNALIVALVLRHFIRAGGEAMIREHWPGPEQSLLLILRVAG